MNVTMTMAERRWHLMMMMMTMAATMAEFNDDDG